MLKNDVNCVCMKYRWMDKYVAKEKNRYDDGVEGVMFVRIYKKNKRKMHHFLYTFDKMFVYEMIDQSKSNILIRFFWSV